jgi:hypothetical protein
MRGVAWWGVVSAVAAPVLLIGGWTVAAGLQPRFDPVADTVSALAAIGATDRWVMSLVFALLAWFGTELILAAHQVGLAERIMGGAQAAWPLAVVLSCYLPVRALAPARRVNQASNA